MNLQEIRATEEYAFYKEKFADMQATDDAFNDMYGFPRKDLAYLHVVHRYTERAQLYSNLLKMYSEALTINRAS